MSGRVSRGMHGRLWPTRCSPGSSFLGLTIRLRGLLGVRLTLEMSANFFGDIYGNGAGMGFLFGYAKPSQQIDNGFRFNLEFAGEFVDTYLGCVTHATLGIFLFLLSFR